MSQTNSEFGQETAQEAVAVSTILSRISSASLLFSAVFVTILLLSWLFLLPRLTQLQWQGQTVSLSAILPYEQSLRAQLVVLEAQRTKLVLPVQDAKYDALKVRKYCYPLVQDIDAQLRAASAKMGENVAHIASLRFVQEGTVTLTGEIHNVGPRSMTVLAQFVKELKGVGIVQDVKPPSFTREKGPQGFYSPFTLTLRIKPSSSCNS